MRLFLLPSAPITVSFHLNITFSIWMFSVLSWTIFCLYKKSGYNWNLITMFLTRTSTLFYDYVKKKKVTVLSQKHLCHMRLPLILCCWILNKILYIYMTHWHTKYIIRLMKKQISGINHFETIKSATGNFENTINYRDKDTFESSDASIRKWTHCLS